jgi:hypothetical protein
MSEDKVKLISDKPVMFSTISEAEAELIRLLDCNLAEQVAIIEGRESKLGDIIKSSEAFCLILKKIEEASPLLQEILINAFLPHLKKPKQLSEIMCDHLSEEDDSLKEKIIGALFKEKRLLSLCSGKYKQKILNVLNPTLRDIVSPKKKKSSLITFVGFYSASIGKSKLSDIKSPDYYLEMEDGFSSNEKTPLITRS